MEITESEGYKKLLAAVEFDIAGQTGRKPQEYQDKLAWVLERAEHYAKRTGLNVVDILNAWERDRRYWYMNYYQDCNQPLLERPCNRIFETVDELHQAIGESGFRCPACGGVSRDPYTCDSGKELSKGKVCDWKSWGLFGTMGKGAFVFVKEKMYGQNIFMPLAWETK